MTDVKIKIRLLLLLLKVLRIRAISSLSIQINNIGDSLEKYETL